MLKYLHFEVACNVAFGIFLGVWVISRHVIYLALCWSIYRDIPAAMEYSCYSASTGAVKDPNTIGHWRYMEPFYTQSGTICFDRKVKWVFLGLLLILQALSIVWFAIIAKIAYKIVRYGAADDSRSSDEEEEEVDDISGGEKLLSNGHLSAMTDEKLRTTMTDPKLPHYRLSPKSGPRLRVSKKDNKKLIGRVGCNGSTIGYNDC